MNHYLNKFCVSSLLLLSSLNANAAHPFVPSFNPEQASNIFRMIGTTQLTRFQEAAVYAGTGTNATLPINYREVPAVSDTSAPTSFAITKAQHVSMVDCGVPAAMVGTGLNSALLSDRIKHCSNVNPTLATWDGVTKGVAGEAKWKLVSRVYTDFYGSKTSREVWQDQRTGLLWGSKPDMADNGAMDDANWCGAAGNNDANDPNGLCNTNVASYCSETLYPGGQQATPGSNFKYEKEDYTLGVYSNSKGQMGLKSAPAVRWRLPTRNDYLQAEIDGLRNVMPDMFSPAVANANTEITATVYSKIRALSWTYNADLGYVTHYPSDSAYTNRQGFRGGIRCVGR